MRNVRIAPASGREKAIAAWNVRRLKSLVNQGLRSAETAGTILYSKTAENAFLTFHDFTAKEVINMAVFRVERTTGYTVMSNHHLRNKELTLKAKGLLSQMLSLPEDWDFTLAGLAYINREKIDAIREAVKELEKAGYIVRSRERDEKGRLRGADYVIYERPQPAEKEAAATEDGQPPILDLPTLENPMLDNPTLEKPTLENPMQLNKDISKKEKIITDVSNIHQSIYPAEPEDAPPFGGIDEIDGNSAVSIYRDIIKDNIEYEALCGQFDPERVDEIVELILETVCSTAKYIKVGGEKYPAELVKSRLMKIGQFHIEYVFDRIDKNTTKVYNIRAYMLKTLFSAPSTMGHFYTAEVNHDFYGSDWGAPKKKGIPDYTCNPGDSL